MQPKVLQKLLGHTDITITMNTYCDAFESYTNANLELAEKYIDKVLMSNQNQEKEEQNQEKEEQQQLVVPLEVGA